MSRNKKAIGNIHAFIIEPQTVNFDRASSPVEQKFAGGLVA